MFVRDVMTRGPKCLKPTSTLREAAQQMEQLNVGSLPICGEDDKLAGIITDRDIVIRAIAAGKDADTPVQEAMTPRIVCCFEDQSIEEAADLMKEKQVRRLLVLDRNKRLCGIVSIGDVAVKAHDDSLSGEALEQVSEPAMPHR